MRRWATVSALLIVVSAGMLFVAVAPAAGQTAGDVNLTIEPQYNYAEPGNTTTYSVYVHNATNGIGAYDRISIHVQNTGVAEIVDFSDYASFSASKIQDSGNTLYLEGASLNSVYEPASGPSYRIANFTIQSTGTTGKTTNLIFDPSADSRMSDYDTTFYTIDSFENATHTVGILEAHLSQLDIAGHGTDAIIGAGTNATVRTTLTNLLSQSETLNVSLRIDRIGAAETGLVVNRSVQLGATNSTVVSYPDVTDTLQPGFYRVEFATVDVPLVDTISGMLTISVDATDDGNLATDTNGDYLLDDVDGDQRFDIFDVQAFFSALEEPVTRDNPALFDFRDDGDIDIIDIQALFEDLTVTG